MNDTKGRNLDLILEVTRKCNFTCEHCLRGDARNTELSRDIYARIIQNFGTLATEVMITGGEPLLHPMVWKWLERTVKEGGLLASSFWACTNGSINPLPALQSLHNIHNVGASCSMQVSTDDYHDEEPDKFYQSHIIGFNIMHADEDIEHPRRSSEKPLGSTICMGRAKNFIEYSRENYLKVYNPFSEDNISIYVSCEGKIYPSCDLSYDAMDLEDLVLWDLTKDPVVDLDKIEAKCKEIFGGGDRILIYPEGDYIEI